MVDHNYTGYVRVNTQRSKHHGKIGEMITWSYKSGVKFGKVQFEDKTVASIVLTNLDKASKPVTLSVDDDRKVYRVRSVITKASDGSKIESMSEDMTEADAIELATKRKIANPEDLISIWKMTAVIGTPRTLADVIPVI